MPLVFEENAQIAIQRLACNIAKLGSTMVGHQGGWIYCDRHVGIWVAGIGLQLVLQIVGYLTVDSRNSFDLHPCDTVWSGEHDSWWFGCHGSCTCSATGFQWRGAGVGGICGNSDAFGDILVGHTVGFYKFAVFITHVEARALKLGLPDSL